MQTAPAEPKSKTADRHKKRYMISFKPAIYRQLRELAKRNHRPVNWESELIVLAALEAAGLWPPDAQSKE